MQHRCIEIHTCIAFRISWYSLSLSRSLFYPILIPVSGSNSYPRIRRHRIRNRILLRLRRSCCRRRLQQRLEERKSNKTRFETSASTHFPNVAHTGETISLLVVFDSIKDVADIPDATFRKFAIVRSIPAGR